MAEEKLNVKKIHVIVLLLLVFAGCLFVLSFINYSNGDDTYFLIFCKEMGFGEYLKWRYETWTGRMASEALAHIFFNHDIWFWRIVNAGMLTALPLVLVLLKNKVKVRYHQELKLCEPEGMRRFGAALLMCMFFYLLLDIRTFGYSCIWITGSINYLWPVVCGVIALCAVAAEKGYAIGVICGLVASMSSEQMGAVLLAFEVIAIAEAVWRKNRLRIGLMFQTGFTVMGFVVSGMAPGNELRVAESIEYYMPQFDTLTLGERGFLLIQWLVSSFANENSMFLILIWIAGSLWLLEQKQQEKNGLKRNRMMLLCAVAFTLTAMAGKIGVGVLTDIGINLPKMTGTITQIPTAVDMEFGQWCALTWWLAALLFTLFFIWKVTERNIVVLLTYLGACASEAIMILSPTIYSSGERVFFLTCLMLMFIVLVLYDRLEDKRMRRGFAVCVAAMGMVNLLLQAKELLQMITG